MAATLLYGIAASYLVARVSGRRWQVLGIALAFCMVILVAYSRLYLGVHYLSDVLAAMAAGLAWLALCLVVIAALWHQRAAAARHSVTA